MEELSLVFLTGTNCSTVKYQTPSCRVKMGRSKVQYNTWLSFFNLRTTSSNLSNVNIAVQHDMCAGESGLEEESVHEKYSFNSDKNHHGKDMERYTFL